ncbi:hypothetical protein WA158_001417 [Blastocystis sp. Blastoise]
MTTQQDYVYSIYGKNVTIPIVQTYDENIGSCVWASGQVMADYIASKSTFFSGKHILELGCGPGLSGIVAAKVGARVYLTDKDNPETLLKTCEMNCIINNIYESCSIFSLNWGHFASNMCQIPALDWIIGSDIFYDSKLFDDLLCTLSYYFSVFPKLQTLFVIQERVSLYCLKKHIKKWNFDYRFEQVEQSILDKYKANETLLYLYISKCNTSF